MLPEINPTIKLPFSGDCFSVNTLTLEQRELPAPLCEVFMQRGIFLSTDDWKALKFTLLKNCNTNDCKQSAGAFDVLFDTVDQALGKMPHVPIR